MVELEAEPLFKDIAEVAAKYKADSLLNPKSKNGKVLETFNSMKESLKVILKTLIGTKRFTYCPCVDLIM
jgi:hypothetical protein